MNVLNYKDTQEYLDKVLPYNRVKINSSDIDLEVLYEAQKIMAQIVKKYGNQYLPTFIKIHKEIECRKTELSYEKIALQIANDNSL